MESVTEQRVDGRTFELTTTTDGADQCCASPTCQAAPDDHLSLTLGASMQGMHADYGTVGFCSVDCLHRFLELEQLRVVDRPTYIFTTAPVLATIHYKGQELAHALGHDLAAASNRAVEIVADRVDDGLPLDAHEIRYDRLTTDDAATEEGP